MLSNLATTSKHLNMSSKIDQIVTCPNSSVGAQHLSYKADSVSKVSCIQKSCRSLKPVMKASEQNCSSVQTCDHSDRPQAKNVIESSLSKRKYLDSLSPHTYTTNWLLLLTSCRAEKHAYTLPKKSTFFAESLLMFWMQCHFTVSDDLGLQSSVTITRHVYLACLNDVADVPTCQSSSLIWSDGTFPDWPYIFLDLKWKWECPFQKKNEAYC